MQSTHAGHLQVRDDLNEHKSVFAKEERRICEEKSRGTSDEATGQNKVTPCLDRFSSVIIGNAASDNLRNLILADESMHLFKKIIA
jgi:hypothetical protein